MAVKTSWSSGDVLTAADLTDTFAAKGDVAGETWTGTHDFTGATVSGVLPSNDGAYIATEQSTGSTSYTDLATSGPAVTLTTGTKALVILRARAYNSTGATSYLGFAVSGSSTVSANDDKAAMYAGSSYQTMSVAVLVTGLTAGSNTFTTKYRCSGSTSYFGTRQMIVMDMGS